ncbi:epidermal growth factor-activated receptor [Mactra antiquata]
MPDIVIILFLRQSNATNTVWGTDLVAFWGGHDVLREYQFPNKSTYMTIIGHVATTGKDINAELVNFDECSTSTDLCTPNQHCVNTIGSFVCKCNTGLEMDSTGKTCTGPTFYTLSVIDIDECLSNPCDHKCNNTFGSYECICKEGYTLEDGHKCIDINECLANNGGCQQQCINNEGSYKCECYQGYELNTSGVCVDEREKVFGVYRLPRQMLPEPCYDLTLELPFGEYCELDIIMSSTSRWLRLRDDPSIIYTHGISFVKIRNNVIPISMQGVVIMNEPFKIIPIVQYAIEDGVFIQSTKTSSDCDNLNITKSYIFDFVHADSFLKTYFDSLTDQLPFWLNFATSNGPIMSVRDMKTDLMYGHDIGVYPECSEAPITRNHLYSVMVFNTNFIVKNYFRNHLLKSPERYEKYCIIADICTESFGTIFFMAPEGGREQLSKIKIFETLKNHLKLQLKPYGLGFSNLNGIQVYTQEETSAIWSGDGNISYSPPTSANLWIGCDMEKEDKFFFAKGDTDIYLDVEDMEMLLVSFGRMNWNGKIKTVITDAPIFKFKVFGEEYEIKIPVATETVEAFFAVGGNNSSGCNPSFNPSGVYFVLSIDGTPFDGIPYLKDWFSSNKDWQVFVSNTPRQIMPDSNRFSKDIFKVPNVLSTIINAITTSQTDLMADDELFAISMHIQTGLTIFKSIITDGLQNKWDSKDTEAIMYRVVMLRQFFGYADQAFSEFNDLAEFNENENIKALRQTLKNAAIDIGDFIGNTSFSVTDATFLETEDYTKFGFKGNVEFIFLGLNFTSINLELFHSDNHYFNCPKFRPIIEFEDGSGERALRFIGISNSNPVKFGRFISLIDRRLIEGALSLHINKTALQFQPVVRMVGVSGYETVYVTSARGLYFTSKRKVWNEFVANINVSADVRKDWIDLKYNLKGRFVQTVGSNVRPEMDTFKDRYLDTLRNSLNQNLDRTRQRLADAQHNLDKTKTTLTIATKWLEEQEGDIEETYTAFVNAVTELDIAEKKLAELKASHIEAKKALEDAQLDVDNLCKIQKCEDTCMSRRVCQWTKSCETCSPYYFCMNLQCYIRIPDDKCNVANELCKQLREEAYANLNEVDRMVKEVMLEYEDATSNYSFAKLELKRTRELYAAAQDRLKWAHIGFDLADSNVKTAMEYFNNIKKDAKVEEQTLQLISEKGLENLLDVRDCTFEIEIAIADVSVFNVSCEVDALDLGWKKMEFALDFVDIRSSLWSVAQTTVEILLKRFSETINRKRRSLESKVNSKYHGFKRITRQTNTDSTNDLTDKSLYLNNEDLFNRTKTFTKNCQIFEFWIDFLHRAFTALYKEANNAYENTLALHKFIGYIYTKINNRNINFDTATLNYLNFNTTVAAREYSLSKADIERIITRFKNNDRTMEKLEMVDRALVISNEIILDTFNKIESVVNWYFRLNNLTNNLPIRCFGLSDCIQTSLLNISNLLEGQYYLNAQKDKASIKMIQNNVKKMWTVSIINYEDIAKVFDHCRKEIESLKDSNLFRHTAPTMKEHPKNASVLEGNSVTLSCAADGSTPLAYQWYRDKDLLYNEKKETLVLEDLKIADNGSEVYCIVSNIVAITKSKNAIVTVYVHDIDECDNNNGNCEHTCLNTIGSYMCKCPEGFTTSNTDSHSCIDINECERNYDSGGCEHHCTNSVGGFNCSCKDGFVLDTRSCIDVDECLLDNGSCGKDTCKNLNGSYECNCRVGFVRNETTGLCDQVDECKTNNGGCQHLCIDTTGSYKCQCETGYDLDGHQCKDIDECKSNFGNCDDLCVNTPGSFTCSCVTGSLASDGLKCIRPNMVE